MLNRVLILALLSLAGCKSSPAVMEPAKLWDMDPLEFIAYLQSHGTSDCYYVRAAPSGWVKQKHLPQLFQLLDSDRNCALPLYFAESPHTAMGKGSTVGQEAAFMIMGFRGKAYPPPLGSCVTNQEKKAMRAWWQQCRNEKE
mgnify:FL=1|jgi:hypothetical protein